MQFVFKRDEEGKERIYVGDVLVGVIHDANHNIVTHWPERGVTWENILDAIERADEAGFWEHYAEVALHGCDAKWTLPSEVPVDVPVADNVVLSVTKGGDES